MLDRSFRNSVASATTKRGPNVASKITSSAAAVNMTQIGLKQTLRVTNEGKGYMCKQRKTYTAPRDLMNNRRASTPGSPEGDVVMEVLWRPLKRWEKRANLLLLRNDMRTRKHASTKNTAATRRATGTHGALPPRPR